MKNLGTVKVTDIVENSDGTCTVNMELTDEFMSSIKNHYGWKRWSPKKFQKLLLEGLTKSVANMELEDQSANNSGNNLNRIDVFDPK